MASLWRGLSKAVLLVALMLPVSSAALDGISDPSNYMRGMTHVFGRDADLSPDEARAYLVATHEFALAVPANDLNPALTDIPISRWLKTLGSPKAIVEWEIGGMSLIPPDIMNGWRMPWEMYQERTYLWCGYTIRVVDGDSELSIFLESASWPYTERSQKVKISRVALVDHRGSVSDAPQKFESLGEAASGFQALRVDRSRRRFVGFGLSLLAAIVCGVLGFSIARWRRESI